MSSLDPSHISAVLFDLDETLLDRTGSLRRFLQSQWREHDQLQHVPQQAFIDSFLNLDHRGRVGKDTVYPQLLERFGVADAGLSQALLQEYQHGFCQFARAFDGMDALLSGLRERGYKLGVITNGETGMQTRSLQALGLPDKVDAILISDSEGLRKPDPRIFLRAARQLNVEGSQCLYVGDTPEADVMAAQSCGMQAIWFPNGAVWPKHKPQSANATITGLGELLQIIGVEPHF